MTLHRQELQGGAMTVDKLYAENLLASFLGLIIAGCTVSSCASTSLRIVTPSNAPPDISSRWPTNDSAAHRGISIGGPSFIGHEIIAAADGVIVFADFNNVSGGRVRIFHGLNSNGQKLYTDHFHVFGQLLKNGDEVKRGQTLGYMWRGRSNANLPHYHFIVTEEESTNEFIALNPRDFWFGIDQYKEKLAKGLDVGPFAIFCFNPNVNYPTEPIRFTYPVKCK